MATPKGMRAQQFQVNDTDAVHVYSDHTHIWVQCDATYPPTSTSAEHPSSSQSVCSRAPHTSWGSN